MAQFHIKIDFLLKNFSLSVNDVLGGFIFWLSRTFSVYVGKSKSAKFRLNQLKFQILFIVCVLTQMN